AAFGLTLIDGEHAIMDVMRAHLDHIAPALAGVEDQREGEPRLGPYRMRRLECRDLGLGPTLVSGGLQVHRLTPSAGLSGMRPSPTAHSNIARSVLIRLCCANGVDAFSLTMRCTCSRISSMTRREPSIRYSGLLPCARRKASSVHRRVRCVSLPSVLNGELEFGSR